MTLSVIKEGADSLIDGYADNYIVNQFPWPGLSTVFLLQYTEAVLSKTVGSPALTAENYPMLASLVGLAAPTLSGVVDHVLATARQWAAPLAVINQRRLVQKAMVSAAEDEAAVSHIINNLTWA